ncbi:type II toxin-antitoxin system PemK/MazF family toxin [Sphingobacteriales bacterium UPWRP_1]|nr:growth inhibitor PemK [Sphingobacteriales bacterium TSM_CSM]PSJ74807.1 type II toxin-antitoxin system PemK/MazF family toxin [Sphingobacteriales bacterium UPWRP_1]
MTFAQYEIVIVNLDPTVGNKIKKTRPCVIVSPNEMNRHLTAIVVCPVTTQSKNYPTRVSFYLDGHTNWIVTDQIRAIDKSLITKTLGNLDNGDIKQLNPNFS